MFGNHGREESKLLSLLKHWEIRLPPLRKGWRFASLQISSVAYPRSSTVNYFNQMCSVSNLNDWLFVDGVFFVIRCIILLSNKSEKLKQVASLLFLTKCCSVERSLYRPIDSRHDRHDNSQNAP